MQTLSHQTLLGREVYYNQGLLGFISRLISDVKLRFNLNLLITLIICSIVFWKRRAHSFIEKISLLLTLLTILDPLSWQHHFIFLILPFITTYFAIQKNFFWRYILIFFLSYFLVSGNIQQPQEFIQFPFSLLLSHPFYGGFLLLILEIILFSSRTKKVISSENNYYK